MPFAAAFLLKDPKKVRLLGKEISAIADRHTLVRGAEILLRAEQALRGPLGQELIYDLIEAGVLLKRQPATSIDGYLFSIDSSAIHDFIEKEAIAAEAIRLLEHRFKEDCPISVSFAATVPEGFEAASEGFEEIYPALIRIAASATQQLWIVNPFVDEYGAESLLPSLIGAAKCGVEIRILGRQVFDPSKQIFEKGVGTILSEFHKNDLLGSIQLRDLFLQDENGRQIYGLHTKMMIADATMAYIGSANLTKHSLRSNYELGVILRGKGILPLLSITNKLWDVSTVINLEPFIAECAR